MQPSRIVQQHWVMPRHWIKRPASPFLKRFLGKFVLDIMPAALASVIGGFLFTQYHFGHAAPPHPAAEAVVPASAEMMALVRDEHAMIVDYLKTQMAAEKSRMAAEDADQRAADAKAADAKATDAKAAEAKVALEASARRIAAAASTTRPVAARAKPAVATVAMTTPAMTTPAMTTPAHAPLVIAQADQTPEEAVPPPDRLARDPNSLLGKTLDLKDHVVAATRHVVFMIGDVFNAVGERIGGGPAPGPRQFSWES
jgi:hypothetical protein